MSQQVAQLERLTGTRLVERTPGARTATLTVAGTRLARHADAILARLGQARDELAAGERSLRLGAVPSVAAAFLGRIVRAVPAAVELVESIRPDELLDQLVAGRLDLVLAPTTRERTGVRRRVLLRDPYLLIVQRGHRLARLRRSVVASDLEGLQLIAKDCDTPSQRALASALAAHGIRVAVRLRAHDARTVAGLVADGHGIAVIPRLMHGKEAGVVAVAADALVPPREIALHARADEARSREEAKVEAAVLEAAAR